MKVDRGRINRIVFIYGLLSLSWLTCFHFIAGDAGKSWLLFAAHKWLDGKKLYVDIFEVNPPLIYYIYALPVYLSIHVGGLRHYQYLTLLGVIAIAFTTFVSLQLIKFHSCFASDKKKQAEFCLLVLSVFISYTIPLYFMDREHLFLVLAFPYLLRWMPSIPAAQVPKRIQVMTGVMGGIGFCIKPQCIIIFTGIQLIYLMRERSAAILWSMENIIIYTLGALYIASVFYFTPEYITTVIPMAMATYGVINENWGNAFHASIILLTFSVTFADFRLRYVSPYRKDILYLLELCPFFILYIYTNNGWGYTWSLLRSIILMVTGFVLWEFAYLREERLSQGEDHKQFLFGMRACTINLCVNMAVALATSFYALSAACGDYFECDTAKKFIEDIRAVNGGKMPGSFGTISNEVATWAHFSDVTGARWETRFNHLWMLPKFFVSSPGFAQRNKWITNYVTHALAEDMKHNRPEIIFVEDTELFYSVHRYVDLVAYLKASPEFEEEWRHYSYAGAIVTPYAAQKTAEHLGYDMYKRVD